MATTTFGGDRLGTGAGFTTHQRAYERTTHDLGDSFASNLGVGMVAMVYAEFGKRGDVWDMDIRPYILTHPTGGPLFDMFEFRVAVFTADTRLYNRQLHNNKKGIGLKMETVIFPKMRLNGPNIDKSLGGDYNAQQICQSSLLAMSGTRGLGTLAEPNGTGRVEILRNAELILAYYETISEYIANKQEEKAYVIAYVEGEGQVIVHEALMEGTVGWNGENINDSKETEISIDAGATITIRGRGVDRSNVYAIRYGENAPRLMTDIVEWNSIRENEGEVVYERALTNQMIKRNVGTEEFIWGSGVYGAEPGEELQLVEFPLSNIDDVREQIFMQENSSPYIIGYYGEEDKGYPYRAVVGQTEIGRGGVPEEGSMIQSYGEWAGLCLATYKADRWQTWLNEGWIEQANEISNVDTSSGNFGMNALAMSIRLWNFNNSLAATGGSYQDWLTAVDGMETYGAPEMPVYRGGCSCNIHFDEVVSSSEYSDQPLGTLGGEGVMSNVKGGRVRFKLEENGWVYALAWITPIISYSQGNKWYTKLETMDDIHKPIFDGIGFQAKTTDQMAAWDTKVSPGGVETFFSVGYEPSWMEYWTREPRIYGSFTRENDEAYMKLGRRYEMDDSGRILDLTTYIDPTKYLYPFSYLGLSYGPFWVHVQFDVTARRIMSGAKMPHLIR